MRSLSLAFSLVGVLVSTVHATHFRYGTISYKVPDSTSAPTVAEVTVTTAWRSSFIDGVSLNFGDGASTFIAASQWDILGSLVDAAGESYTLVSKTVSRDYQAVGDYHAYFLSCCRISTLQNAPDQSFRVEATIKLGADDNGPSASLPAIMTMTGGMYNSLDINGFLADIDNDAYSCMMNSLAGNFYFAPIPLTPGPGYPLIVTSDCKLEWDLSDYAPVDNPKYAVSMLIENSKNVVVPLDFIIEINSVSSAPLTCDAVGDVAFTAQEGSIVTADFLVAGGPSGSTVGNVMVAVAGPMGATLAANSPSSSPLPEEFQFHFLVPTGSAGVLQWVLQFQLGSQSCFQGVSILICNDDDADGVCNEADICPQGDDSVDSDGDGTPDACEDTDGSIRGDPHISRWNQASFDFHGECDLLMLHSDHVNEDKTLDLHIRTTIRNFYSSIEVAALGVGEHVLEVDSKTFFYNGAEMKDDDLPFECPEFTLKGPVLTPGFQHRREYQVVLNDASIVTFIKTKNFVSIAITGHHKDFEGSTGLLGKFPTGEALGRDGRVVTDWIEYGMEWQISPEEPMLFREFRAPQLPFASCYMPLGSMETQRRRLRGGSDFDTYLWDQAQVACRHAAGGSDFDACVDDVMMTGDLTFAEAY